MKMDYVRKFFLTALAALLLASAEHSVAAPLEVDLRSASVVLEQQGSDVQREQIADWALLALMQGRPLSEVAAATLDLPPLRMRWLDSVLDQPYGAGRAVAVSKDEAWIVVPADAPDLRTMVGRLADQLRAGTATSPARIKVFLYTRDQRGTRLSIADPLEYDAAQIWGEPFDYRISPVAAPSDIGAWLGSGRDLTMLRSTGDGAILEGRRLCPAQALDFKLADVATIVAARLEIDIEAGEAAGRIGTLNSEYNKPAEDFNALVNVANKGIGEANRLARTPQQATAEQFAKQALELAKLLNVTLPSGAATDIDHWKDVVSSLSDAVDAKRTALQAKAEQELAAQGPPLPQDPGFSLDPLLDTARLQNDLEAVAAQPSIVAGKAAAVWTAHRGDAPSTRPRLAWLARDFLTELALEKYEQAADDDANAAEPAAEIELQLMMANFAANGGNADELDAAYRELAEIGARYVDDWTAPAALASAAGQLSQQFEIATTRAQAEEALWKARTFVDLQDGMIGTALKLMLADAEVQCARYDGALDGSAVGMTLFYTDTVAKLWAAIDYDGSAPVRAVPGFLSMPVMGGLPEIYRDEVEKKNATRMWFGARESAATGAPNDADGLLLPAWYARVFARGSGGGFRTVEAVPNEESRRVFDWWDQNFLEIARYEPQYERLNQIMKWSLVSIWMSGHPVFGQAEAWQPLSDSRDRRWRSWHEDNRELKFATPLQLQRVPKMQGLGLECFPLFRSRPYRTFETGSEWSYITGGVSLVERSKVKEGLGSPTPLEQVDVARRRAALRYSDATNATNSRGAKIRHESTSDLQRVVIEPPPAVPMRDGALEINPERVSLVYSRTGTTLVAASNVRVDGHAVRTANVRVERTGDTVRITADPGDLALVKRAVERMARSESLPTPGVDVYSLGAGSGGFLLRVMDRSVSGDASIPRWFFAGAAKSATENTALRSSGRAIRPLTNAEANAKAAEYRYLVLAADGRDVVRELRRDGPSTAAEAVSIAWNNSALRDSPLRVDDGRLFIERPQDAADVEAFRDLVEHEGITAAFIGTVAASTGASVAAPLTPRDAIAERIRSGSAEEQMRAIALSGGTELLAAARQRVRALNEMPPALVNELQRLGVPESAEALARDVVRSVLEGDQAKLQELVAPVQKEPHGSDRHSAVLAALRMLGRANRATPDTAGKWDTPDYRDRMVLLADGGMVLTELRVAPDGVVPVAGDVGTRDQGTVYIEASGGTPIFVPARVTLKFEVTDPIVLDELQTLGQAEGQLPDAISHGGRSYVRSVNGGGGRDGGGANAPLYLASLAAATSAEAQVNPECGLPLPKDQNDE